MLEILGVSFWLASVGVIQFGDSIAVVDEGEIDPETIHRQILQEVIGNALWGPIPWVLAMWAALLNNVIVRRSRIFGSTPGRREVSVVLPVSGDSSQDDGMRQNRRKDRLEVQGSAVLSAKCSFPGNLSLSGIRC